MRYGVHEACLDHDPGPRHPESPDRIRAIRAALDDRDAEFVTAPPADESLVRTVHDADYLDRLRALCADDGGAWDPDTVASEATYEAALAAVGQARWAIDRALAGDDGTATPFALGRPPGHHALADDAMGFCFCNNVAVAARTALDDGAERVAVVDWDVHHGNGTQALFADSPDVLYVSLHEDGCYPGTGRVDEVGTGAGEGTTCNLPLPPGAGDPDYRHAVDEAVEPVVRRFDPDLVVVSAGFDAHRDDAISRGRLSTDGYAMLADRTRAVADDRGAGLAFVLEGGYDLDALPASVVAVDETIAGERSGVVEGSPSDRTTEVVERVRARHG